MNANAGKMRLLRLREISEAKGEEMDRERGRFEALASPSAAPRVVSAFNLFQTPQAVADRMAGLLAEHIGTACRVLEPSAGLGRLYRAIRDAGHDGPLDLIEQSPDCCRELYGQTEGDTAATLKTRDFLETTVEELGLYDAIIMNPPFKMWRDIKHIRHACTFLKYGGRLVSLCAAGPKQRAAFETTADHWEMLPAGSFKSEGTSVDVALIVIDRQ